MFSSIVAEVLAARLRLGCSEAAARNQTYVRSGALAAASRHPRREDPSQIQWHQGCSTGECVYPKLSKILVNSNIQVQIADLQIPQSLVMQSIHLRAPLMKNWTELN